MSFVLRTAVAAAALAITASAGFPNATLSPHAIEDPEWKYDGCVSSSNPGEFALVETSSAMTVERCLYQCSAYDFALVHDNQCFCSQSVKSTSSAGDGGCNTPCPGDPNESCGGQVSSNPSSRRNLRRYYSPSNDPYQSQTTTTTTISDSPVTTSSSDTGSSDSSSSTSDYSSETSDSSPASTTSGGTDSSSSTDSSTDSSTNSGGSSSTTDSNSGSSSTTDSNSGSSSTTDSNSGSSSTTSNSQPTATTDLYSLYEKTIVPLGHVYIKVITQIYLDICDTCPSGLSTCTASHTTTLTGCGCPSPSTPSVPMVTTTASCGACMNAGGPGVVTITLPSGVTPGQGQTTTPCPTFVVVPATTETPCSTLAVWSTAVTPTGPVFTGAANGLKRGAAGVAALMAAVAML